MAPDHGTETLSSTAPSGRSARLMREMLGLDLGKLNAVGDLQGGIEAAERILGYRVVAPDTLEPLGEQVAGTDPQAR